MVILEQYNEAKNLAKLIEVFQLNKQIQLPQLTDDVIKNENLLQSTTQRIRTEWLRKISIHASSFDKSPWEGQIPSDVWGNQFKFSYETLLSNDALPDYFGYEIEGYQNKTYLFPNGMSAIKGTLDIIDSILVEPLKICASVGYFETVNYLNMLVNRGAELKDLNDQTGSAVDANVFLFEPMRYNFSSDITNDELLIAKVNASTASLKFLVMDSTMHNITGIFNNVLDRIINPQNVIFVDVRSGLKLDQSGLEITNLGIGIWFVSKQAPRFEEFLFDFIQKYKGISGANLALVNLLGLAYDHHDLSSSDYLGAVTDNVRYFISNYRHANSSYISEIRYGEGTFMGERLDAPFVFFKLNTQDKNDYIAFIENIKEHFAAKGLFLPFRNSWGFRYPSIEYIEDYYSKELILKVYLGMFKGAVFQELLDFFNDLSSSEPSEVLIKKFFNK